MSAAFSRRQFLRASTIGALTAYGLSRAEASYPGNFRAAIPASASTRIDELYSEQRGLRDIAFTSEGGWVMLWDNNGYASENIPEALAAKLKELNSAGKLIYSVAIAPDNGWIVRYAEDTSIDYWTSAGMPDELISVLRRLDVENSTVKCVAFTQDGGWAILHGFNGYHAVGIPQASRDALDSLRTVGVPLRHIAFGSNDAWVIISGRNGHNSSGCSADLTQKLGEYNSAGKFILAVEFSKDGGWIVLYHADNGPLERYVTINGHNPGGARLNAYLSGFAGSSAQLTVVHQALSVLHDRFLSWPVIQNSYSISRNAYYIQDKYWNDCNVEAHPKYGPRELLLYQLSTLSLPVGAQLADDEGPPMPEIRLYFYHRPDESWGYARWSNRVLVKYVDDAIVKRTGDFRVHLNMYHLGSAGDGSDPYMWACVIGHEMLHNLGHAHDVDDYSDNRQINCFHRALYCNGRFRGQNVPSFKCACKPPI